MKKVLLSIFAVAAFAMTVNAQSIIDAEDGSNPNDFYQKGIVIGKRAMPYAMNRIYAWTDRPGQERVGQTPEKWNFAARPSDYVILNLGTNDCYALLFSRDFEKARAQFLDDYTDFLKEIRRLNGPETEIICALGSMNYYLYPEIEQAVRTLREQTGDRRIHSFRYRPMAPLDGYGAAGHPSGTTQRKMGQELADFIRSL